jgi:hypothetical protein
MADNQTTPATEEVKEVVVEKTAKAKEVVAEKTTEVKKLLLKRRQK